MKTLLIILFLFGSLFANDNLKWVDQQVSAIKPPRKGLSNNTLVRLRDPFIYVKSAPKTVGPTTKTSTTASVKKATVKEVLKLKMIMNKKALINGQWLHINDTIQGYKVIKIDKESVTLVQGKKTKKLFMKSKSSKIKFNVK